MFLNIDIGITEIFSDIFTHRIWPVFFSEITELLHNSISLEEYWWHWLAEKWARYTPIHTWQIPVKVKKLYIYLWVNKKINWINLFANLSNESVMQITSTVKTDLVVCHGRENNLFIEQNEKSQTITFGHDFDMATIILWLWK